jgi:N-dimethylarginine dimethylaminohydrolase
LLETISRPRYDHSMAKRVLMCPPTFFDVREPKNPYMGRPIDHAKAVQQWENLRQSLERSGLEVETINPVEDLDDMVFAANQVFVGHHSKIGKFIVPSRMRYPSRQKEVAFYVEWFRARGYAVIDLDLDGEFLEGHGDLLWHPDHSRIWAASGFRSTPGGVAKFAKAMQEMDFPVTPLELVDDHCYHLDTCLCPLNLEAVLIYPGAYSPPSLAAVRSAWRRVHELSRAEALQFMGNGIVANDRFITSRLSPNVSEVLAQEGLTPVLVDTSEFEKSGGSVFCMKNVIE